jgi:beta-mannosidase
MMLPVVQALDGEWQLRMTEHDAGDAAELISLEEDWMPATVPGDVHQALMDAGVIADVHIGSNAMECQWVSQKDWWLRKRFVAPEQLGDYTELQMDGLDVYATIWLNGVELGKSDNAFLQWRKRVDEVIKPGEENVLLVRLESVSERLGRTKFTGWNDDWGPRGVLRAKVRKPQYSFGWDWAPVLPSIGIWRSVRLKSWRQYHISDVYVRSQVSGQVDVFVTMSHQVHEGQLEVRIQGHGYEARQVIDLHGANHYANFHIPDPQLWWPAGYGAPNLYTYEVYYKEDGKVLDARQGRFGIREVQVFEEPYPGGMSWGLQVNGEKVFCKGANWIPCEMFPGIVRPNKLYTALERAKEADFNMLRVWGGGVYEDELFYDWCDANGIMIWQDFMFAGTLYDVSDPDFRRSVIKEAEYQVKRLRNNPCIVLWCGTNEDGKSWGYRSEQNDDAGMEVAVDRKSRLELDNELFSMILRGTVSRFTQEPYVESSPQSHEDYGNHPASGNSHLSVHKYCLDYSAEEYRRYFDTIVAFNSEFCIQGPARASSIRRFMPADHLWPPDTMWKYHMSQGHRNYYHYELHIKYAEDLYGPVNSLDDYSKLGAAMHAEFTRAEYESARRYKWACGGTMVWMHNDCWPTSNWSIFDYYNVAKPAFYAAKRACAPVLPIIFPLGDQVQFYVTADTLQSYQGTAVIGQETLTGEVLWQEQLNISLPANSSVCYYSRAQSSLVQDVNSVLFMDVTLGDMTLERVYYFPFLWKKVRWPEPNIRLAVLEQKQSGGRVQTRVQVSTDVFAHFCHLDVLPLEEHFLSDNFFDLGAGRSRVITIDSPRPVKLADIQVGHWLTTWL